MNWTEQTVLITGGNGYIGSHLARHLLTTLPDVTVHVTVRPTSDLTRLTDSLTRLHVHPVDITDHAAITTLLHTIQPTVVFHFATNRHHADWTHLLAVNVQATLHLMRMCAEVGVARIVYAGSSQEYGAGEPPFRESDALHPTTFYGATKAAASLFIEQMVAADNLPVVNLRFFYVYGKDENSTRLIPTAMRAALTHTPITLTADTYRRDFVFIDDVVRACMLAASVPTAVGQVFNIASGHQWTNAEVVAVVSEVLERPIIVQAQDFPPRVWDKADWVADVGHAAVHLNWQASIDLAEGIRQTLLWQARYD